MKKGLLDTYKEFQKKLLELLAEGKGTSDEAEILFAEADELWDGLTREELNILQRR